MPRPALLLLQASTCCALFDAPSHCISPTHSNDSTALTENFCLIESRDSVKVRPYAHGNSTSSTHCKQDFAMLNLKEIETSIEARRNKIFLLMEEVRRLRMQRKNQGTQWLPVQPSFTSRTGA